MKDILHDIINDMNDKWYKEKVKKDPDYDRAKKDFYIEGKTDYEVYLIAHTLVKISRFVEGRKYEDTNKRKKENLLNELDNIEKQLYMFGFVDEAIDHLRPIIAKVKRSEIKSEKQQILSITNYVEEELHSINSNNSNINNILPFINKALSEIARNREKYKDNLDKIEALI